MCPVIGNLSGIPVRIYESGKQILYHSIVRLPADPLIAFRQQVLTLDSHVAYFITPDFHYYGVVNSGEYKIVMGPSVQTKNSDQVLKELAFQCDVSADDTDDFIRGMKSIVPMPLDSVLQILCTMNYIMNNEKLNLGDLRIYDSEQQHLKDQLEEARATNNFDADIKSAFEQKTFITRSRSSRPSSTTFFSATFPPSKSGLPTHPP